MTRHIPQTKPAAPTDAGDIIAVAQQAVTASERVTTVKDLPCAIEADGKITVLHDVLLVADSRADRPVRRKGVATLTTLDSFVAHARRFLTPTTVVFAEADRHRMLAIFDYHNADGCAWNDHRAQYACPPSVEYMLWSGLAARTFSLEQLAELIDDNIADLAMPPEELAASGYATPAALLSWLTAFEWERATRVTQKWNRTTGLRELLIRHEDGHTEDSPIPRGFLLAIPLFDGGPRFPLACPIRVRLRDHKVAIGFDIPAAKRTVDQAFRDMAANVGELLERPVFFGTPEE